MLGTQGTQQGDTSLLSSFPVLALGSTMCPVTEAWTRHRGDVQEAAVTSGQKGQRDLFQWEEIGGFMESLWET